jgi:hypothetical protein
MTSDGHDVFFESGDLLVPRDHAPTPSIYDARVGGGEAPEEAPPGDCAGESCPLATPVPEEVTPASSRFNGPGNPTSTRPHCRKGQHRVRRAGRSRCVRKHHRRKRKSGPSKHRRTAR